MEIASRTRTYLRPTAPIAPDALFPGDPATAMAIARHLVEAPLMANHSYGLWGYSGRTAAGLELTVQATGIGGPSAAVVLGELAVHGVERAIRIGLARPLDPALGAGDVIVAESAIGVDGTSRALGLEGPARPDRELTEALARECGPAARLGTVASADLDLPLEPGPGAALDLETAAMLAAADRAGVRLAAALVISEPDPGEPDARLEGTMLALGAACAAALGG